MRVKMVKHKKALEVLKFQNLKTSLKNPETLLRSPQFVIHQNLQHHAITVSNLIRNWSISTQISCPCQNVTNWGTPNLLQQCLLGMPSEALLWFVYVYMVCLFIKLITSGNTKIYRKEWRSPKTDGF